LQAPRIEEKYCTHCRVTAPGEAQRCVHCGGRLLRGRLLPVGWAQAALEPVAREELHESPFAAAEDEAQPDPRIGKVKRAVTLVWVLLVLIPMFYRMCK